MKLFRFASNVVASLLVLSAFVGGGQAQTPSAADSSLKKTFAQGFLKGCLGGKITDVRNQANYCCCMANSYQSRYDGRTLTAISQLAGATGDRGPALVNLMMTPEAMSCKARSK